MDCTFFFVICLMLFIFSMPLSLYLNGCDNEVGGGCFQYNVIRNNSCVYIKPNYIKTSDETEPSGSFDCVLSNGVKCSMNADGCTESIHSLNNKIYTATNTNDCYCYSQISSLSIWGFSYMIIILGLFILVCIIYIKENKEGYDIYIKTNNFNYINDNDEDFDAQL